jgi:hypothetical protein
MDGLKEVRNLNNPSNPSKNLGFIILLSQINMYAGC